MKTLTATDDSLLCARPGWSFGTSSTSSPASSAAASPRRRARRTSRSRRCPTRWRAWSARPGRSCSSGARVEALRPTEAGRLLLARAREAAAAVEGFAHDMAALSGLTRGELLVGSIQSLNATLLPVPIAAFVGALPRHRAGRAHASRRRRSRTRSGTGARRSASSRARRPRRWAGSPVRRLYQERFVAIVRRADPLARRRQIPMAALRDRALALVPAGTYTGAVIHGACERAGFIPHVAVTLDSGEGLREIVRAGKAITILPERYLPAHDDRLCAVAPRRPDTDARRARAAQSRALRDARRRGVHAARRRSRRRKTFTTQRGKRADRKFF